MPELRSYLKQELPREIAVQIRSYIRMQWPGLGTELTKIVAPPSPWVRDRQAFVLMEDELLISHADANFRTIEHGGQAYEVGGLSAVFTYPAHRGKGLGEIVVRAATEFLQERSADFALLFCGERVQTLYERVGWTLLPAARIYYGDAANPTVKNDGLIMGLFISDRGRAFKPVLEQEPVYVGPFTW